MRRRLHVPLLIRCSTLMLGKIFPYNPQIIAGVDFAPRSDYVWRMHQSRYRAGKSFRVYLDLHLAWRSPAHNGNGARPILITFKFETRKKPASMKRRRVSV